MIATGQLSAGDILLVDINKTENEFCFRKACGELAMGLSSVFMLPPAVELN